MRHVLFFLNPIITFQDVLDICRIKKGGINLAGNFQPSHKEEICCPKKSSRSKDCSLLLHTPLKADICWWKDQI